MDRIEAAEILDTFVEDNNYSDYHKALRMAIDALKEQLSCEGTTSDLISKTETVKRLRGVLESTVPITDYDGGYIDGIESGISTVSTMPTIQPEPTIPLSWIENEIKWLKSLDNTFSEITALQISAMVKKWEGEQNG